MLIPYFKTGYIRYGYIFGTAAVFSHLEDFYVRKQADPLVAMPLAMSVICRSRSSVAFFAPLGRPLLCRVQMAIEFIVKTFVNLLVLGCLLALEF